MNFPDLILTMTIFLVLMGSGPKAIAQVSPAILISEIEIMGNTVFSDAELKSALAPLTKTAITLEQLLQLIPQLTKYYVDRGYISSGAFLPTQKMTDGKIEIQIVESNLTDIKIKGLSRLKDSYIKKRLTILNQPLNIKTLTRSLAKLQNDPLIEKLSGEIIQHERGSNILLLSIEETPPFNASLRLTNSYSPSIGSFGGIAQISHHNLLGFGDSLSLDRSQTEGLRRTTASYSVPVNSLDGRVFFSYTTAKSSLVEQELHPLDIEADYDALELNIRQPVISSPTEELTLGMGWKNIQSETFVLGDLSFAFTEGLKNGESNITLLNLSQEYSNRDRGSLIAMRSQFEIGLDAFGATKTEMGIDGIFWRWQGDFQYLISLNEKNQTILATRIATQLTPDKLPPLEQFTVGGLGSIRGYRRNLGSGDNGIKGTIELQLPLVDGQWGKISLLPFFDVGTVWNNGGRETTGSNTFASTGLGLRYRFDSALEARIDYGIPLIEAKGFGASETTDNFTFSLKVRPLSF